MHIESPVRPTARRKLFAQFGDARPFPTSHARLGRRKIATDAGHGRPELGVDLEVKLARVTSVGGHGWKVALAMTVGVLGAVAVKVTLTELAGVGLINRISGSGLNPELSNGPVRVSFT